MCVNRTYSRYQRTVIDLLNKQLGDRPFSYEKAQNNHLKVLIDGVSRPIYTGSTPSDVKSGKNFMSEVNREIRKSQKTDDPSMTLVTPPQEQPSFQNKHSKLIRNLAKYIRQTRPSLMAKEIKIVEDAQNTEDLLTHRKTLKETLVQNALKNRKEDDYLLPKELRFIESEVNKHIEFTLPTMAYYSEQILKNNAPIHSTSKQEKQSQQDKSNTLRTLPTHTTQKKSSPKVETKEKKLIKPHHTEENDILTSLIQESLPLTFMEESSENRIEQFKTLSHQQIESLIADLQSARTLKREDDIQLILQLMDEKSITIDDLQSKW